MSRKFRAALLLTGVGALLSAVSLVAHHSERPNSTPTKPVKVSGVVKRGRVDQPSYLVLRRGQG